MELLRKALAVLLIGLAPHTFALPTWNGIAITGWNGIAITALNEVSGGGGSPTLVASDDFAWAPPGWNPITNDTDWAYLHPGGRTYTYNNGSGLTGVQSYTSGTGYSGAFYNSVASSLNQRVEITLDFSLSPTSSSWIGVACRASSDNYYGVIVDQAGTSCYFYKWIAGVETMFSNPTITAVTGDKLAIEVTGGSGASTRLTVQLYSGGSWANVSGMANIDPGDYLPAGKGAITGYDSKGDTEPVVMGKDFKWYDLP